MYDDCIRVHIPMASKYDIASKILDKVLEALS